VGDRKLAQQPTNWQAEQISNVFGTPAAIEEASLELPPGLEPIDRTNPSAVLLGVGLPGAKDNELPPGLERSVSSPGERATQVGLGAVEGAIRYGTPMAAATTAFRATAPVAELPGRLPKVVPFIAALGAYGGAYLLSDPAAEMLPEAPEGMEAWREGGVTAGGMLGGSLSAGILSAPRLTQYFGVIPNAGPRIYKLMNKWGDVSRRPGYFASEAITAGTAGAAGGTMVSLYPDSPMYRLGAEFTASVFTPGTLVSNGIDVAYTAARDAIRNARGGADIRAANNLYNALDRILKQRSDLVTLSQIDSPAAREAERFLTGKFYTDLINELEAPTVPLARPTAAQKTGSPELAIFEAALVRGDSVFGARVQQQGIDAISAYKTLIERLQQVGDQKSLVAAARLQEELYDSMVLGRIGMAERKAADAASKITTDTPSSRAQLGDTISRNITGALRDARSYERALWDRAFLEGSSIYNGTVTPKQVVPNETLKYFLKVASRMTVERYKELPLSIKSIMGRLGITEDSISTYKRGMQTEAYRQTGVVPDGYVIGGIKTAQDGTVTYSPLGVKTDVDELIRIRSDFLNWARDAASGVGGQTSSVDARLYSGLAASVLDDLGQLPGRAYDDARAFSRALNDNFTRSYARDINAVTRTGADKIAPEILVSQAFGRNPDVSALRAEQVQDAVGLFARQYEDLYQQLNQMRSAGASAVEREALEQRLRELQPFATTAMERVSSVSEAVEKTYRILATDPSILNPQTGRINPTALSGWMARNEPILRRFGALTDDLKNALDAENALRLVENPNSPLARAAKDQEAFSSVLIGGEKPVTAVSDALRSRKPAEALNKLVTTAETASNKTGALSGLKSSLYEWAYIEAGGLGNNFNAQVFRDRLFMPVSPGGPSVVSTLRSRGLMTSQEINNLRRLVEPINRARRAMDNKAAIDSILTNGSPLDAFAVRFAALHLGSNAIPSGPGSLAAASVVSQTAQELFNKMPRLNALVALKEAAENPAIMAALLRKGRSDQDKINALQNAADTMAAYSLIIPSRAIVPSMNVEQERQKQPPPPAPSTRGSPVGGQTGGQAPAAPPAAGPQASASRLMLQQMFPNDPILGAAALQSALPS
jgi:hypothetical protein